MFINLTIWNILRPALFVLPILAVLGIAFEFFRTGRNRLATAAVALSGVVGLFSLAAYGHGALKPYVVHVLSGTEYDMKLTEFAVFYGKAYEYRGVSYPALKRDIVVNDSDCLALIERVEYRARNAAPSPLDQLGSLPGFASNGPIEILPRSVYEKDPAKRFDDRISIDYCGFGPSAPPQTISKQVPEKYRTGAASWLFSRETRNWLRWESYDAEEYAYRKQLEELSASVQRLRAGGSDSVQAFLDRMK